MIRAVIERKSRDYERRYGFPDGFLSAIIQIESAWNPNAKRNESRGRYSMGLMQVLRGGGAVDEWEKLNGKKRDQFYFRPEYNLRVGSWYLGEKIRSYLDHFGHEKTIENYVIAYNAGIGNLNKYKKGLKPLPSYTKRYLKKLSDLGFVSKRNIRPVKPWIMVALGAVLFKKYF